MGDRRGAAVPDIAVRRRATTTAVRRPAAATSRTAAAGRTQGATGTDNAAVGTSGGTGGNGAATAFGRVITAMITPFDGAGRVDDRAAELLAGRLVRNGWNDAILVNGTAGESNATDDEEKRRMIFAVRRAVAGTARKVIAGIGSGDTAHSVRLAGTAHEAGADGLLVAAPYYSSPSQLGLLEHFRAIADATPLPVMLCDIPQRTGVAIEPETLRAAAEHPRILAVMDATEDLSAASALMHSTDLAFYSGDDMLNLPWLSVGATGFVSVVGHVVGDRLQTLLRLHDQGRNAEALSLHRQLLPIYGGMLRAPAAASVKAALRALGLPGGQVRLPLLDLTEDQYRQIRMDLVATVTELGVPLGSGTPAASVIPRTPGPAGPRNGSGDGREVASA
ncbi:MAG: 4-hydroxy-tetrahydrodipicolinate synthase [Micrococcus sp.]|nr:4-hydroxy-tetrahydrodipicolinate synthase [Micrococcus sp.]